MNTANDIIGPFIKGQSDCERGIPQQSGDPNYMRGYAAQYELEQCQTRKTEQMMEKAHGSYKD